MTQILMTVVATVLLLTSSAVQAQEASHYPSRVALLIHGDHEIIKDDTQIAFLMIPSGNLIGPLSPITYLGIKKKVTEHLGVEVYGGWAFEDDEPLVSLSFNVKSGNLWAWTEIDLRFPSSNCYWFAQAEYQLNSWFHAGVEGDGWGSFSGNSSWSNGAGPNLIFTFDKIGVDLTVHARDESQIKPQFFLRMHLFL